MMLLFAGLALLAVIATGVAADSLITVPISKRIDFNGIPDFTKRDREHLRNLVKRGGYRRQSSTAHKTTGIPLNNTGGIYVATIGTGEPATSLRTVSLVNFCLARSLIFSPKTNSLLIPGAPRPGWERTSITLKPRTV